MLYVYGYLGSTMMFLGLQFGGKADQDPKTSAFVQYCKAAGYTKVHATSFQNMQAKFRPFRN